MLTRAERASLAALHYNASVDSVITGAPEVRILRVRPDAGAGAFAPGQHLRLGLGVWEEREPGGDAEEIPEGAARDLVTREYSLSHPILDPSSSELIEPGALDAYEFFISGRGRPAEPGAVRLTPRLMRLRSGDRLFAEAEPKGDYGLEPVRPGDDLLFVSTGTGVAPHNAMIWHLLRRRHEGRIACIVSTRFAAEQAYRRVHEELARRFPRFFFVSLATREPAGQRGGVHLQDVFAGGRLAGLLGWTPDPERSHVYLCGDPAMIGADGRGGESGREGMIPILERMGFRSAPGQGRAPNVHFEKF